MYDIIIVGKIVLMILHSQNKEYKFIKIQILACSFKTPIISDTDHSEITVRVTQVLINPNILVLWMCAPMDHSKYGLRQH